MDQESAYLKVLGEAKTYAVKGDQLTLTGGDGTQLAVYKAQSQDLAGTSWEATAYNNGKQAVVGVLEGTTLTASFGKTAPCLEILDAINTPGAYKVEWRRDHDRTPGVYDDDV